MTTYVGKHIRETGCDLSWITMGEGAHATRAWRWQMNSMQWSERWRLGSGGLCGPGVVWLLRRLVEPLTCVVNPAACGHVQAPSLLMPETAEADVDNQ